MTANGTEGIPAKQPPPLQITTPASLLAAVPRLMAFQPRDSLVVVGMEEPRGQVHVTLRYDLPDPPDIGICRQIAEHAISVLSAQRIETAAVVGYGPTERVAPLAEALLSRSTEFGVHISDLLRVEGQRYWSYARGNLQCWPPEGTPFTAEGDPAAGGAGPVLASRAELAATLSPIEGEPADRMDRATRATEEHLARLTARAARPGDGESGRGFIIGAGTLAVIDALALYHNGGSLPAGDELAWLSVVLKNLRVRDGAWARMAPERKEAHLRLWTDLTRLARPGYVAPAASLLAFVAWQAGNGALANVALDRALNDTPEYSMAHLLRAALDSGAPPSMARLPMTPEEVDAAYAADDDECDCRAAARINAEEGGPGDDLSILLFAADEYRKPAEDTGHKPLASEPRFWSPAGHP